VPAVPGWATLRTRYFPCPRLRANEAFSAVVTVMVVAVLLDGRYEPEPANDAMKLAVRVG
jgi:hypothetical protein